MTVVKLLNNINPPKKANLMHLWDCSTTVSHNVGKSRQHFSALSRRGAAQPLMTSARRKCGVSHTTRSFPSPVLKQLQASPTLSGTASARPSKCVSSSVSSAVSLVAFTLLAFPSPAPRRHLVYFIQLRVVKLISFGQC